MSEVLLATACMLVVWSSCAVLIVWAIRKPKRDANAALAQLNHSLRFTTRTTQESLWPAAKEQFTWGTWPVLQGSRAAYRCEVTVQPRARHQPPLTWLTVSGPHDVSGRVVVTRPPELPIFLKSLDPFAPTKTVDDETQRRNFEHAALGRFIAPVRAKVLELPRRWIHVGFDGSAMLLAWHGMELNVAIVEQAFQIGQECLEMLGERAGAGREQWHTNRRPSSRPAT